MKSISLIFIVGLLSSSLVSAQNQFKLKTDSIDLEKDIMCSRLLQEPLKLNLPTEKKQNSTGKPNQQLLSANQKLIHSPGFKHPDKGDFPYRMPVLKPQFQSKMPVMKPDSTIHFFIQNKKF
jgi:hypothetical protein